MITIVMPVYKNVDNLPDLIRALQQLDLDLQGEMEAVFVVDGSPDDSYEHLACQLPSVSFSSQLICLSRNFGAFSAIRAGLAAGRGDLFAVMAADLQEPPSLVLAFNQMLADGEADVVVGQRMSRNDPWHTKFLSRLFWIFYRRLVLPELPPGGVDVFGCTRAVRDHILQIRENHSSLVGILFWVGFRRMAIPYSRQKRVIGHSAWTISKRLKYLADSVYGFTDLPIRLLIGFGSIGIVASVVLGVVVLIGRLTGKIIVPGYTPTVLTVVFFGALNCFGLGVIGNYVWRAFENTKSRPGYIVSSHKAFSGSPKTAVRNHE